MLVGREGRYEKPTHPCLVPGCKEKSFQAKDGACKHHMMAKVNWLRNKVMSTPSPWVVQVVSEAGTDVQGSVGPTEPDR